MVAASHNSLTDTVEEEELAQTECTSASDSYTVKLFIFTGPECTLFMSGVVKKRDQKRIHPVIVT